MASKGGAAPRCGDTSEQAATSTVVTHMGDPAAAAERPCGCAAAAPCCKLTCTRSCKLTVHAPPSFPLQSDFGEGVTRHGDRCGNASIPAWPRCRQLFQLQAPLERRATHTKQSTNVSGAADAAVRCFDAVAAASIWARCICSPLVPQAVPADVAVAPRLELPRGRWAERSGAAGGSPRATSARTPCPANAKAWRSESSHTCAARSLR